MERLTTNKTVSEMGMYELAHNSCYIGKNGAARYRDFDTYIDARNFVRKLMIAFEQWKCMEEYGLDADNELVDDDIFDESMLDYLFHDSTTITGLIALFYRNLWAMAELREKLKQYEDLEEQGLLLRFSCKIGDRAYVFSKEWNRVYPITVASIVICKNCIFLKDGRGTSFILGTEAFLTFREAEAALKEMEK